MTGQYNGQNYNWDSIDALHQWPHPPRNVQGELDELKDLIEFRSGMIAEGLGERTELITYYAGLLMFSQGSHPSTFDLAQIGMTVARFVAMHYKWKYNRPRPSQLSPALMPPIAVPGHASFPSGHATAAYLISSLLAQVMPNVVSNILPPVPQSGHPQPGASLLERLAERIARNREVFGLHYPSDSAAGKFLAERTSALLVQCPMVMELLPGGRYDATKEWR